MEVRDVTIAELLDAGEAGRGLLELVSKSGANLAMSYKRVNLFDGGTRDVWEVFFNGDHIIERLRSVDGGQEMMSGLSSYSYSGLPDAISRLFNSVSSPGASIRYYPIQHPREAITVTYQCGHWAPPRWPH